MATSQLEKSVSLQPAGVEAEPSTAENTNWEQANEIDNAYLRGSKTSKFWRSVLFQMILFGAYGYILTQLSVHG